MTPISRVHMLNFKTHKNDLDFYFLCCQKFQMVGYNPHKFKFENNIAKYYFCLLCKYYPPVEIKVIVNGNNTISGHNTMDFYQSLPASHEYEVIITKCGRHGTIKAMPKYQRTDKTPSESILKIIEPIDLLLGIIESKSRLNIACSIDLAVENFQQLIEALPYLTTPNITRQYICHKSEEIFLILQEKYGIYLTPEIVSGSELPIFDLDDGFDGWVPTAEFNEYFKIWLEKFKRTMGESWDENIIKD